MTTQTISRKPSPRIAQYWALTKPRVTQLAVFCAVIGMFLASEELPDWRAVVFGTIGIWLLAGAAFAVNCLAEREIDAGLIAATVEGIADIRASEEGREGVQSFLQKRKPSWLTA